jgi:hypothetical protein
MQIRPILPYTQSHHLLFGETKKEKQAKIIKEQPTGKGEDAPTGSVDKPGKSARLSRQDAPTGKVDK